MHKNIEREQVVTQGKLKKAKLTTAYSADMYATLDKHHRELAEMFNEVADTLEKDYP